MSLKISNLATDKQKAILKKLEYHGVGQYTLERLNIADAADLITELFEEERLLNRREYNEPNSDR